MENKLGKIEAILFVAGKPLSYKEIGDITGINKKEIKELISDLNKKYQETESGLNCVMTGEKVQLFTSSEYSELVNNYLEQERQADLTKPSLETLSIIAYRGPVSKEEMEQIRGVNCSLILRNLLIRGLVTEKESGGQKVYEVTHDFLRFLGVSEAKDLPDFEKLNENKNLNDFLKNRSEEEEGEEEVEKVKVEVEEND